MSMQIRNLVVGLVDAEAPDLGVRAAAEVARTTGALLHVVHALPPAAPRAAEPPPAQEGEVLAAHAEYLRTVASSRLPAAGADLRLAFHALDLSPEHALRAVAERHGAELIVVGASPHHRPGYGRLGTTARRLLRDGHRAVLLVRSTYAPPRRVLAATDLSAGSRIALGTALQLLDALSAPARPATRVLWVMPAGVVPPPLPADTLLRAGGSLLRGFLEELGGDLQPAMREGAPAEEVLREVAVWNPDLAVLGTHGRRGVRRIRMGSVAESILAELSCNALVVPRGAAESGETVRARAVEAEAPTAAPEEVPSDPAPALAAGASRSA